MNSLSAVQGNTIKDDALPVSLMVSVGDLSADKHTAHILNKLKALQPDLHVWGLGSTHMQNAGAEILYDCQEFSSIGLAGVIKVLPFLAKVRGALLKAIEKRRPRAVLLVDYSGFNLVLAKAIRARYKDLPIYYFISPQIWGSRPWRIKTIAKTITKMLVIFPFEETLYKEKNIPVSFVGHPLTNNLPKASQLLSREAFAQKYNLDPQKPIISIFPGSRKNEIKNLLPIPAKAAKLLVKEYPQTQFALSIAHSSLTAAIERFIGSDPELAQIIRLIPPEDSHNLMAICNLAWAKSGTTTLELALFAKPMLIFYRADWISYLIFLAFKRTRRVGWPNLLAAKDLVPELIQLDCTPEKLVQYSKDILSTPSMGQEISQELISLKDKLGEGNYADNCAFELAQVLNTK